MAVSKSSKRLRLHPGVFAAVVAICACYLLLDSQFQFGPRWLAPVLIAALAALLFVARHFDKHDHAHLLGLGIAGLATAMLIGGIAVLASEMLRGNLSPTHLLQDAALLWISNILIFSLWYWELDGGGPSHRHFNGYQPTDFAFPQTALGKPYDLEWAPGYTDYLFVAFNTSSAFSPTDTMVLSSRAKLLSMSQSLIAIISLAVFAARAINSLR